MGARSRIARTLRRPSASTAPRRDADRTAPKSAKKAAKKTAAKPANKPAKQAAAQAAAQPALPAEPDPTDWTRDEVFGAAFTARSLGDFVDPSPQVEWRETNPLLDRSRAELLDLVLAEHRWRYHHGLAELMGSEALYGAYADRVDAMLEMLDGERALGSVDVSATSFLDLGAAEGYVVNHLLDRGARDIDAVELNEGNIQRMWMVRALKDQRVGRIGRIDLDRADWSRALGRTYDVVLALGVIYHMENPLLFARNLYAATDRFAIVESDTPVFPKNSRFRGFGNVYLHRDQVTLAPGDVRHLTEMRPDRQALVEILLAAGFREVHALPPSTHATSAYFDRGDKSVLVAVR